MLTGLRILQITPRRLKLHGHTRHVALNLIMRHDQGLTSPLHLDDFARQRIALLSGGGHSRGNRCRWLRFGAAGRQADRGH